MIRNLYQKLDDRLNELEEKFRLDEQKIKNEIDKEIKSQMIEKLKKKNIKKTQDYGKNFLDIFGKCNSLISLGSQTTENYGMFNYGRMNESYIESIISENIHTTRGFFYILNKLNDDKSLQKDEYIIGIYGDMNINYSSSLSYSNNYNNLGNLDNIILISNYYNSYQLINQYPNSQNQTNKKFNEVYQIKLLKKNNIILQDELIDYINNIFNKVNIKLNQQNQGSGNKVLNFHTLYDISVYDSFMYNLLQYNYNSYSNDKSSMFQGLPQQCLNELEVSFTINKNENIEDFSKYIKTCCKDHHQKSQNEFLVQIRKFQVNSVDLGKNTDQNYYEYIFEVFDKYFNDFWLDKIKKVTSRKDIKTNELLVQNEEEIKKLREENISLKSKNEELKTEVESCYISNEYQEELKELVAKYKDDVNTIEKEKKELENSYQELNEKYQKLKGKLISLVDN